MTATTAFRGDYIEVGLAVATSASVPIDLTGYSASSMIRKCSSTGTGELVATWDVEILDQGVTENIGKIRLSLDASVARALPTAVLSYDVELVDPDGRPATIGPLELIILPDQTHA